MITGSDDLAELTTVLARHADTLVHDARVVAKALNPQVTLTGDPRYHRDQMEDFE